MHFHEYFSFEHFKVRGQAKINQLFQPTPLACIRRFGHNFSNTLYYVNYSESKFKQTMLAQFFGQHVCQFTNTMLGTVDEVDDNI